MGGLIPTWHIKILLEVNVMSKQLRDFISDYKPLVLICVNADNAEENEIKVEPHISEMQKKYLECTEWDAQPFGYGKLYVECYFRE